LEQYIQMSKKLATIYHTTKDTEGKEKLFELFCIKRQKIVVNARKKFEKFGEIMENLKNPNIFRTKSTSQNARYKIRSGLPLLATPPCCEHPAWYPCIPLLYIKIIIEQIG